MYKLILVAGCVFAAILMVVVINALAWIYGGDDDKYKLILACLLDSVCLIGLIALCIYETIGGN